MDNITIKTNHLYLVKYERDYSSKKKGTTYHVKELITGYFNNDPEDDENYFFGMAYGMSKNGKPYRQESIISRFYFKDTCEVLQDLGELV